MHLIVLEKVILVLLAVMHNLPFIVVVLHTAVEQQLVELVVLVHLNLNINYFAVGSSQAKKSSHIHDQKKSPSSSSTMSCEVSKRRICFSWFCYSRGALRIVRISFSLLESYQ